MQTVERRGLERFELRIPAKVQAVTADRSPELQNLHTSNICSGGDFFQAAQPLPEGTEVKVDLTLNLDKFKGLNEKYRQVYIKIKGRVIRSEPNGMPVSFDDDYLIVPLRNESNIGNYFK